MNENRGLVHLPITNLIRDDDIILQLELVCQRIDVADDLQIFGQIAKRRLEQRGQLLIHDAVLFKPNTSQHRDSMPATAFRRSCLGAVVVVVLPCFD